MLQVSFLLIYCAQTNSTKYSIFKVQYLILSLIKDKPQYVGCRTINPRLFGTKHEVRHLPLPLDPPLLAHTRLTVIKVAHLVLNHDHETAEAADSNEYFEA